MDRIREAGENVAIVDENEDDDDGGGRALASRMTRRDEDDVNVVFGGPLDGISPVDDVDSWQ